MPIETFNFLDSLNVNNPPTSDGLLGGDDHIRGIKAALKNTFPHVTGPINSTQTQIDAIAALLVNGVLRGNGACPAGALVDFGGTTAPAGWLACDGQAISRTTYADLYAAIGTTWGAGDGSTTFNVPSLASYFRRHRDNNPLLAGAVGNKRNPANLAHYHNVAGNTGAASNDHVHNVAGSTGAMSANATHSHTSNAPTRTNFAGSGNDGPFGFPQQGSVATIDATNTDHVHAFNVNSGGMSANHSHALNVNSGGGTADDANEARPYSATVLTCIKT